MVTKGEQFIGNNGKVIGVMGQIAGVHTSENESSILLAMPNGGPTVDVYKPCEKYGQMVRSEINWAGCGSQSPAFTQMFIRMLDIAVTLAVLADQEAGLK